MSWLSTEPFTWLRLRWPRTVTVEQAAAALRALNGLSTPQLLRPNVILETAGNADQIEHRLAVAASRAPAAVHQLRQAIAGLVVEEMTAAPRRPAQRAWTIWLSTKRRPLAVEHSVGVSHALLTALAGANSSEQLTLQWLLGPVRRPSAIPRGVQRDIKGASLLTLLWGAPSELDSEARRALAAKEGEPGWRAVGRLAVAASTTKRQRQLLGRLSAALRMMQGASVELGVRPSSAEVVRRAATPWNYPLTLNVAELAGLSGWPLEETVTLPVQRTMSRPLPPSRRIPSCGRIIAHATYPGEERPLALNAQDALTHLHVLGPTGIGKSTIALNLITQDMAAGHSVVVIEPKFQLIGDVLARVPRERLDDVVIMSPADDQPLGLNPLDAGNRSAELVVDQLLPVFRSLYDSWGPRLQEILHASLLTLAADRQATLCHLIPLLADAEFRAPYVSRVQGDLALASFWRGFSQMSDAERQTALQPVLSRLRAFLLRPRLRAVLGQAQPRFDIRQVFRRPRILLIDLSEGDLGPTACQLLGGLVISQLWHAILGRASTPPEQRRPVFCYFDEWQNYVRLSVDVADALAMARGLGVGLVLIHQLFAQLDPALRAAVLANARSRIVGRLAYDDAAVIVRGQSLLEAEDVMSLPAFEGYAQLVADGTVTSFASVRTLPPPPVCSDAEELRQRSRDRYGVPATDVEASLRQLMQLDHEAVPTVIGHRPRRAQKGGG